MLPLHIIDEGGDLLTVADESGDAGCGLGLYDLAGDDVGEDGGDDRDGYDHQEVELAPERPAVEEGVGSAPDPGLPACPSRCFHLVRGHQASGNVISNGQ